MAKNEYSKYQKKVIGAFYRNRDAIETQRLQEIVTEIYLATTPAKQKKLWERAAELLERTPDVKPEYAAKIIAARDVEALAKLAGTRFGA
jgi:hypothetical protein